MKKIAVIFGGVSSEYSVSLASAQAVLENIDQTLYQPVPLGITKEGQWYYYKGDYKLISSDQWQSDRENLAAAVLCADRKVHGLLVIEEKKIETLYLDAIFPVMHGKNGEDGTIQGLAELSGIPLIGCAVLSSALCMDKLRAHQLVSLAGIKTARSFRLQRPYAMEGILKQLKDFSFPLYVKPNKSGSSYGITRLTKPEGLRTAIELAFEYDDEVLIEENINGFEVGCALLEKGNQLISGEVDEIEVAQGFFDYTEKYTLATALIHLPARLSPQERSRIIETAKTIYRCLGCRGFARVDLFYTGEKEIVFNEVNTIPGFTAHSRYPKMMEAAGMNFKALVNTLIEEGLR